MFPLASKLIWGCIFACMYSLHAVAQVSMALLQYGRRVRVRKSTTVTSCRVWHDVSLECMRLTMCVVQPVPYEPCHGRPDSQPARPRLPPGCGSQTRSSPSAGAPQPLRTLSLRQRWNNKLTNIKITIIPHYVCKAMPHLPWTKGSVLTTTLVDSPRLLIQVIRVRLVKVESLIWVGHWSTMLGLIWKRHTRRQDWARQVCLGAAMWIPLVSQLPEKYSKRCSRYPLVVFWLDNCITSVLYIQLLWKSYSTVVSNEIIYIYIYSIYIYTTHKKLFDF